MNILLKIFHRFETWFNKTFGRYFTNARKKDIADDERQAKTYTVDPDDPTENFNEWQGWIRGQRTGELRRNKKPGR